MDYRNHRDRNVRKEQQKNNSVISSGLVPALLQQKTVQGSSSRRLQQSPFLSLQQHYLLSSEGSPIYAARHQRRARSH